MERTVAHPWHSLSVGAHAPEYVHAYIEIAKGSRVKYELDKESGLLKVDRMLHEGITYPCNYGFIPQTYGHDHDPLDILVFCSEQLQPSSFVEVRVIGGISMIDGGQQDDKIIAVMHQDPFYAHITALDEILAYGRQSIKTFLQTYKLPEKKVTEVNDFFSAHTAHELIKQGMDAYTHTVVHKK